eukprot:3498552-Ditylum_brightwellii.AAC.1
MLHFPCLCAIPADALPLQKWYGAEGSEAGAPHQFWGGIPFGVASFVFEASAAELLVAAGTA